MALYALGSIGTGVACALETVRPLADAEDLDLRFAAVKVLWDIESDSADAVPRLIALFDTGKDHDAADVLGRIGGPAAVALPRLRQVWVESFTGLRGGSSRAWCESCASGAATAPIAAGRASEAGLRRRLGSPVVAVSPSGCLVDGGPAGALQCLVVLDAPEEAAASAGEGEFGVDPWKGRCGGGAHPL
ncbi:hypothetical protein [Kitasatospora sp. NPDC093102]|uniref:hypothetical protein n=1 Tax=Kitasatospora sp. NPDC093102 TaxID=3155069 RepID=UPI00341B1D69